MAGEEVRGVVERYLQLVDHLLPGQIQGLYLVGSAALEDYRPGQSDVDFVALTQTPLLEQDLDGLERVHRELAAEIPEPWFDGIYVTWAGLARNPMDIEHVPFSLEGTFQRTRGFDANPSIWLTVRTHPLSMRGPSEPAVWHDPAVTRRWNVDNLNSYWRGLMARGRSVESRLALLASTRMLNQAISWCVPGVTRLHYTIATGEITSKSGACLYALERFPEQWHPLVREALAVRNGDRVGRRSRQQRYRETLGFMEFVIRDANARFETETDRDASQ